MPNEVLRVPNKYLVVFFGKAARVLDNGLSISPNVVKRIHDNGIVVLPNKTERVLISVKHYFLIR